MQAPKIPDNIFCKKKKRLSEYLPELCPTFAQIFTLAFFFFFFFLGGGSAPPAPPPPAPPPPPRLIRLCMYMYYIKI